MLTCEQQIPRSVRYVLAAVEGLMQSRPAAACEALLGWWNPTSEENQAKIRDAQDQEGYGSEVDMADADCHGGGYEARLLYLLPFSCKIPQETISAFTVLSWQEKQGSEP